MDKLRDEIIEAQKIRADLIKWKLVLVAALGASGLGLGVSEKEGAIPRDGLYILLGLIPFVCTYVDIAARHLNIRMQVIADFMKSYSKTHAEESPILGAYELHCEALHEKGIFELENSILTYSSAFLSVLVILSAYVLPTKPPEGVSMLLVASGLLGLLLAFVVDLLYKKKLELLVTAEK